MYDYKGYRRRCRGVILRAKPKNEEQTAFDRIRNKWDLTDYEIKNLLNDYTVTEIIEGEFNEYGFTPGDRLTTSSIHGSYSDFLNTALIAQ